MNINDLKAFVAEKPSQQSPDVALKQQLREIGLKQAQSINLGTSQSSVSAFSSQTTVGLRVFTGSLNQSLTINDAKPSLESSKESQASLFDFEEVATNVLRFVGSALKGAAAKGVDEETLLGMFEQARSGVLKGIQLAEKDLAGFMNDEISEGISKSKSLIDDGINALQDSLLGNPSEPIANTAVEQSVSYTDIQSGELTINTRDGDQVTIRFEDVEQFESNRQQLLLLQESQKSKINPQQEVVVEPNKQQPQPEKFGLAPQVTDEASELPESKEQASQPVSKTISVEQRYTFVEQSSASFSIAGELDQDEIDAISALVSDTGELTDQFFNGDVEGAFKSAQQLGYNQQELAGFAFQLTRQQQVEAVSVYETVSSYEEGKPLDSDPVQAAKPISRYLDKMLNVLDQAQTLLKDNSSYEKLVNGIVNQVDDIETDDLLSAINRFHTFNNQLLGDIPSNQN